MCTYLWDTTLVAEGYWCDTPIKFDNAIKTPGGSKVTVVTVCVDIDYHVEGEHIILHGVRLSGGSTVGGLVINMASQRTGEAWRAKRIAPDSCLLEAVQKDLSLTDSRLRRTMMGKRRAANPGASAETLVDALNAKASPDRIAELIGAAGRGSEITFTYTKPEGDSEVRRVSVQEVSGNLLRARDHKDGTVKSFRFDRITNARHA